MYLLAVIHREEMSQLLTLKLDVRQHATREDHKSHSSITSKPQIPEGLYIPEYSRK